MLLTLALWAMLQGTPEMPDCPRLRAICSGRLSGTVGRLPFWCADGQLEEWCPLGDAGLTVTGETPAPAPTPRPPVSHNPPAVTGWVEKPVYLAPTDHLEVRCSPKLGLAGYTANLFIRIEHPVKLYCPEVTIEWPGGLRTVREADCEPLEEGEEAEPWSGADLWPDGIRFQVVGRVRVVVEARVGKKSARASCEVEGQG